MRTSLIVAGIIFLVIGGFLWFMPAQSAQATTTTIGESSSDTRTSYATWYAPRALTYALLSIGLVLSVLGFVLPDPRGNVKQNVQAINEEERFTETKSTEEDDGTTRKVTRERHVHHTKEV